MNKRHLCLAVVALAAGLVGAGDERERPAKGKPAPDGRDADRQAIRKATRDLARAFGKGDAKAVAAFWTPEGEYIGPDGEPLRGRKAIARAYAKFFAADKGLELELKPESIRFVGSDAAVEEGVAVRRWPGAKGQATSRYSTLHVRQKGKWLRAIVRESAEPEQASLKDVAWLVGSWQASGKDREARLRFEWAEGKAFLRCRFTLKEKGKEAVSGMQIIGKDPVEGGLRSWVFDSTGGFGEGAWSREGQTWVIESTGTHADGTVTEATNLLTPQGKDAFTWQSVDRSADGEEKPDTDPVKVTRVKADR
jgi:uncharacterized protein (TIGR02246 family)